MDQKLKKQRSSRLTAQEKKTINGEGNTQHLKTMFGVKGSRPFQKWIIQGVFFHNYAPCFPVITSVVCRKATVDKQAD